MLCYPNDPFSQDRSSLKVQSSHHPDLSLKPSSDLRLSQKIHLIDPYIEQDIIAFDRQVIDSFLGDLIGQFTYPLDLTDDGILISLHTIGHKAGFDDRIYILLRQASGHLRIKVDIFDRQTFHSVLVPMLCRL